MPFLKVEVLKSRTGLAQLISSGLSLVRRSLQIIFLMVLESGGQEVVHHRNTYVDSAALKEGGTRDEGREIVGVELPCIQCTCTCTRTHTCVHFEPYKSNMCTCTIMCIQM